MGTWLASSDGRTGQFSPPNRALIVIGHPWAQPFMLPGARNSPGVTPENASEEGVAAGAGQEIDDRHPEIPFHSAAEGVRMMGVAVVGKTRGRALHFALAIGRPACLLKTLGKPHKAGARVGADIADDRTANLFAPEKQAHGVHPAGHIPEGIGGLHPEAQADQLSEHPRHWGSGLPAGLGEEAKSRVEPSERLDSSGQDIGGRRLELKSGKGSDLPLFVSKRAYLVHA